ncbi:MAG: hypothetical protein LBN20_02265 [Endomicrobium sp.]|jgi:cell division protein FtsB|nr:hypothetical protein [Endomicrobium sp.]
MVEIEVELELLSTKIRKLTAKYKELYEQNIKLKAEVDFLKQENRLNSIKASEYAVLKKSVENSIIKVERILKKIDTFKK